MLCVWLFMLPGETDFLKSAYNCKPSSRKVILDHPIYLIVLRDVLALQLFGCP